MDKKKTGRVVIGVAAVLLCGMIYLCNNYRQSSDVVVTEHFTDSGEGQTTVEEPLKESDGKKVYIHICGEVKKPGVYTFEQEPRIIEVVKKAGGFTKKADRTSVNQAQCVSDGTQLSIAARKKKQKATDDPPDGSDSTLETEKVNINTASKEELMTLSGIGESKASQILSYRESNGAFQKIEDIMNISGIKNGVFNKIKDCITV